MYIASYHEEGIEMTVLKKGVPTFERDVAKQGWHTKCASLFNNHPHHL